MKKHVLIADDDSAIRESLKAVLAQSGYSVSLATDGEEAEQQLASDSVDLLLLDLEMPRRNGWDVFDFLIEKHSAVPVIMITGLADQLDTKKIAGLDALLEKPIDVPLLLQTIDRLLIESRDERIQRLSRTFEKCQALGVGSFGYLALHAAAICREW